MNQETAETIALKALSWLAANEELLSVFMGATGGSADDFRTRAAESEFLGSVLDFLTMDDSWVIAFCDTEGLAYDQILMARHSLPGGEQVHWT